MPGFWKPIRNHKLALERAPTDRREEDKANGEVLLSSRFKYQTTGPLSLDDFILGKVYLCYQLLLF